MAQRRRELAIRLALGAGIGEIVRLVTYAVCAVVLLAAVLMAALLPARQAARLPPAVVLGSESGARYRATRRMRALHFEGSTACW